MREARPEEIASALSYALRYDGRKRSHTADEIMAQITADRLVEYLRRSGFVVMKGEPTRQPVEPIPRTDS